jgi:ATP-dependent helicase/nuclease subunit A
MTKNTLKDEQARRRIVTELDMNLIVEAGAGSGKTTVLIDRIVQTIKSGRSTVSQIAAVTFTRKAAAELRQKLQIAFENEHEASPTAQLQQALLDLDRCFVGTIHSFCSRLLRERPVEAGLDPAFEEVEGVDEKLMSEDAWDQYLVEIAQSNPQVIVGLDEVGLKTAELKQTYETLITFPEVLFPVGKTPPPDAVKLRKEIAAVLARVGKLMPDKEPEGGWDPVQGSLHLANRLAKALDLSRLPEVMEIVQLFDRDLSIKSLTQKKWGGKPVALEASGILEEFGASIVQPSVKTWRQHRYQHAMKLAIGAAEYYHQMRKRESKLNFQDLLILSASMLRDFPDVRKYFQLRFTSLFVDEFQDTDPIQAEVVFFLTGKETNQKDWRKLTPRPGSLFVVGDPKQSIYRFRRADIDTYNEVKQVIKNSGGEELALTSSFRSDVSITAPLNGVFKQVFPSEGTSSQAGFEPLDASRTIGKTYPSGTAKLVLRGLANHNKETVASADAECIARYIRAALDGSIKIARTDRERKDGTSETPGPRDFMILLMQRSRMDLYASALESYAIPYEISGGRGFAGSLELHVLLDLLLCLNDPGDPVQFFKVLRGSLFGISDDLFYRYRVAGGRFSIFAEDKSFADLQINTLLMPAIKKVRQYWDWSKNLPAPVTLEKICEDLGLLAFAASGNLANSTTGNILKAIELCRTSPGVTSFARLVEYLQTLLEEDDIEEFSVTTTRPDTVRLMNLHKAKGLEASVVFLANPSLVKPHEPSKRIERSAKGALGYLAVQKPKGEFHQETVAQPPDWETLLAAEAVYESAEKDRLQYVAATRARQLLVISVDEEKPANCPWSPVLDRLKDVPELLIPKASKPAGAESRIDVTDLEKTEKALAALLKKCSVESYGIKTVTSLAHKGAPTPSWVDTGHGLGWGRVVHRVLQLCVPAPPSNVDLVINNAVAEQELPLERWTEVRDLVLSILESPLWKRMLASRERLTEVPFAIKTTSDALGEGGGDRPVVLSGTIDLIFREGDGWVLVDYKTDTISGDIQPFVDYYKMQLELYAKYWAELTGQPFVERILYFTSAHKEVSI